MPDSTFIRERNWLRAQMEDGLSGPGVKKILGSTVEVSCLYGSKKVGKRGKREVISWKYHEDQVPFRDLIGASHKWAFRRGSAEVGSWGGCLLLIGPAAGDHGGVDDRTGTGRLHRLTQE